MPAARLVGLLDHRVVLCLGIATVSIGVSTVAAVGVTAGRCGVATLGVRVVVASAAMTTTAGVALLLLLGLGLGVGIAVAYLRVAGIGVSAVTTRRAGVAASRFRTALIDARLVALRAGAILRTARLVGLLDHRVVGRIGIATVSIGVSTVAAIGIAAGRRGVSTLGVRVAADRDRNRVAVPDLRVAGIGVSAFTAGCGGFATGRVRVALGHAAAVALPGGRHRQRHGGAGRRCSDRHGDRGCDYSRGTSHFRVPSMLEFLLPGRDQGS